MTIRPETAADHPAIRKILVDAFATHPFSRQTEHLIVEALREAGAMTVGLVAEIDGRVLGHIAFSKAEIGGKSCGWYMVGPLAVDPAHQRQGIGTALVRAGLDELRRLGAAGCVLVGDPAYYRRLGFQNDPSVTLEGVPPEVILCMPLADGVPRGEVTHHAAFSVAPEA